MTALDPTKTIRYRGRTGRPEIREAVSADGVWTYIRLEERGTPWDVEHNPTGRVLRYAATSLPSARRSTADGSILADLDRT